MKYNSIFNTALFLPYKNSPKVKQGLGLFSVNVLSIPIGLITSILLTKYLGASDFGNYKFIFSVFNFAIAIFSFGFYQAGSRALVLNNNPSKAKEIYGAEFIITAALYILMVISLLFYILYDSNIQQNNLKNTFLWILPFGWIFLFSKYIDVMIKADKKITLLSESRIYPQVFFIGIIILFLFLLPNHNFVRLKFVLFSYIGTQIAFFIYAFNRLKISFKNLKIRTLEIWNYNRSYGFQVYIGALFGVGLMNLTEILISYFGINNTGVGYYSLALALSSPIALIPSTIATILYRDFAHQDRISNKTIIITIGLSTACLLCLWIAVAPFIKYFYGVSFLPVIRLCYIASIGVMMQGIGDLFNLYLGANGFGKALRNGAISVGIAILTLNVVFIPEYGELGAAYTKLIVGFVYLLCMLWYYFRKLKK